MPTLMLCYARSGGTILNKCLAPLPKIVMLSEVNPVGGGWGKEKENSATTPRQQIEAWYNISQNLFPGNFKKQIYDINNYCEYQGRHLIIRDWTTVNFIEHRYNKKNPSYELKTYDALKKIPNLKIFAFVRNTIDVWLSRNKPDINKFMYGYKKYIEHILRLREADKIKILKYEDFCEDPSFTLRFIMNNAGRAYSQIQYDRASIKGVNYEKVNGNTQNEVVGKQAREVVKLPRKYMSDSDITIVKQARDLQWCNQKLGYE